MIDDDDGMLDEYDFSKGVRGRYAGRKGAVSWNYRVVHRVYPKVPFGNCETYAIHEAYYYSKDATEPHSITVEPISLVADNVEDLAEVLNLIQATLKKPILEYDNFKKTPKPQCPSTT